MKIILLKDIKGLGEEGEMVDAKAGYARNFLLPKGDAIEATPGNVEKWKDKQTEQNERKEVEYKEALELKKKIEDIKIDIKGKAGEGGRLFGSITSSDIAARLKKEHNINVDKRKIELKDNIKALGTTNIDVRVYPELTANLVVNVKEQ